MSTFDPYWAALVRGKPRLANPDAVVTIKADEFRKLLARVHHAGYLEARIAGEQAKHPVAGSMIDDLFSDLFRRFP